MQVYSTLLRTACVLCRTMVKRMVCSVYSAITLGLVVRTVVILVNVVRKNIPDFFFTCSNKGYELLLYIEEETRAKLRNMRIQLLKNMRETSEQTC